jgi:hypothetical protein
MKDMGVTLWTHFFQVPEGQVIVDHESDTKSLGAGDKIYLFDDFEDMSNGLVKPRKCSRFDGDSGLVYVSENLPFFTRDIQFS